MRKVVAKERYNHFQGEYKKVMFELKDIKAKADDYLHQLSFASRVRDVAWADGLHLGFKTFRTWWKDPSRKIDLHQLHVEDIPCTRETLRQLTNLGREEMPEAAGIAVFDYHPPAEDSGATLEGAQNVTTHLIIARLKIFLFKTITHNKADCHSGMAIP